ncbi:bile salt-activated lipase-like [Cimex lectularius]|uniref:Carboxylesterase type B domain-containing protein n=1 Tax=Cimex lectularius TaxID=79782 RepID=A0A8I6S589_CIMLE|nr:bile salt-activated lipase-like [Cimex lectularius]
MRAFVKTIVCMITIVWPTWAKSSIDHLYMKKLETANGVTYAAFEGIRYDQPRMGHDGFQRTFFFPIPVEKEKNLNRSVDCLQLNPANGQFVGQEDCQFLNVYTPMPFENRRMPVLIWIHGTAFPIGSSQGSIYNPKRFMDHEMVVVTMSYRHDILGFASFELKSFPGNYGLNDQRMAINWIMRYIHHFGGDPDRITLGGHGLGAAHALFHMKRGYFPGHRVVKRCIAISGTRYAPWALSYQKWTARKSYQMTRMLRCQHTSSTCISGTNYRTLVNNSNILMRYETEYLWETITWPYRPVLDEDYIKTNPWLDDQNHRNFSLLLGLNKHEGHLIKTFADERGWTQEQKDILVDTFFKLYHPVKLRFMKKVVQRIKEMYDNLGYKEDRVFPLTTDGYFFYPAMMEAENHTGPVQAFMFNFHSKLGVFGCAAPRPSSGVVHGDDLPYLFEMEGCPIAEKDNRIANKYVDMIARFVKDGDAQLKPYSEDKELFSITSAIRNPDEFASFDESIATRMRFWWKLDLYRIPVPQMNYGPFKLRTTVAPLDKQL